MTTIRLRRDTAANWTSNNPILAAGEPGVESDTTKIKYGDGTTQWTSLPYVTGDGGSGAFTTLSASSTVSGNGFSTYLASPPAIGGTTAAAITGTTITANTAFSGPLNGTVGATTPNTGAFTTLSASSTVSGTGFSTYLASPPAIGGTTAAAITGTTITANTAFSGPHNGTVGATTPNTGKFTNLTWTGYTAETVYTGGTTTGTITPDCANGTTQKITLTGSITFNAFANPVAGQSLTLIITQSAAGGLTLTSTMKFSGASKTLSTAANAIDIMTVFYDGSTYYASLAKGFA